MIWSYKQYNSRICFEPRNNTWKYPQRTKWVKQLQMSLQINFLCHITGYKGEFSPKVLLMAQRANILWPPPSQLPQKWGSIVLLVDYYSQKKCPRYYRTEVLALSWIKSVQNCNLKSARINVPQIAAYEPGSLLISYSGSEFYHDGYLRSSTILLWKLGRKVVDVEVIRK